MKFRITALAAGLLAMGSAQALTPTELATASAAGTLKVIRMSGASAQRLAIASAFKEVCNADLHTYFNFNATPSKIGGDYRAYACTLNADFGDVAKNTPVLFIKRDKGGSGLGVVQVANQTAMTFMKVDTTCVNGAGAGAANTDLDVPAFTCAGTEDAVPDAGVSDVEPEMMVNPINMADASIAVDLGKLDTAPFSAGIFGLAVNLNFYRKLQQEQGLGLDDTEANIPSIPSTWFRNAITSSLSSGASFGKGVNYLISTATDPNINGKALNVCRRTNGSGTQAVSNIVFANNPCGLSNAITPSAGTVGATAVKTGNTKIIENEGSGDVINCLTDTAKGGQQGTPTDPFYAIGVLGMENSPFASSGAKAFRYVKIDGKIPKRKYAQTGAYDLVFEGTMQWNTDRISSGSGIGAILASIRNVAGTAAKLKGIDVDFQEGVMARAGSYTGAWLAQADKSFASRVERASLNSCTPLKVSK